MVWGKNWRIKMLNDVDIDTNIDTSWTKEDGGKALAFVIDDNVVYTMAAKLPFYNLLVNFIIKTDQENREIVLLNNNVVEVNNNETFFELNFYKDGQILETITTNQEILRAVLLSNPTIVVLKPEVKRLGVEPGWIYKNENFIKP